MSAEIQTGGLRALCDAYRLDLSVPVAPEQLFPVAWVASNDKYLQLHASRCKRVVSSPLVRGYPSLQILTFEQILQHEGKRGLVCECNPESLPAELLTWLAGAKDTLNALRKIEHVLSGNVEMGWYARGSLVLQMLALEGANLHLIQDESTAALTEELTKLVEITLASAEVWVGKNEVVTAPDERKQWCDRLWLWNTLDSSRSQAVKGYDVLNSSLQGRLLWRSWAALKPGMDFGKLVKNLIRNLKSATPDTESFYAACKSADKAVTDEILADFIALTDEVLTTLRGMNHRLYVVPLLGATRIQTATFLASITDSGIKPRVIPAGPLGEAHLLAAGPAINAVTSAGDVTDLGELLPGDDNMLADAALDFFVSKLDTAGRTYTHTARVLAGKNK